MSSTGRLAGIDYGTVRIGVAITDAERRIASPLVNYTRRGEKADAEFFRRLAEQEQIAGFVVGLPIHLDGNESQKSTESRQFGNGSPTSRAKPSFFSTAVHQQRGRTSSGRHRVNQKTAKGTARQAGSTNLINRVFRGGLSAELRTKKHRFLAKFAKITLRQTI